MTEPGGRAGHLLPRITSLIVKPDGTEVFPPRKQTLNAVSNCKAAQPPRPQGLKPKDHICGNLLQAFVDRPRLMGVWNLDAWNIDADFEKHRWDLSQADEVKLIEAGPLRAIVRIKNHFQNSTFVRDITLYAGVPRVAVTMQAKRKRSVVKAFTSHPRPQPSGGILLSLPSQSVWDGSTA